jgi:general secretion pathway protein E
MMLRMAVTPESLDARATVERLLDTAVQRSASDVHFDPGADHYQVRYRIDGLLEDVERLDVPGGRACVTRLMVLAQLLTYRLDIPQEGRLHHGSAALRLAVMPTTHGLRAVVRMPAELNEPRTLEDLDLGADVLGGLKRFATSDAGMLLLTGPAGSGKTTTIYALLSHITLTQPGLSIVTLEDPVERHLSGVTQIEVAPHGQLTYERALRSILRQDPQVLMLGEIRDRDTASIAVQAALSGHRLIATLHAGSPATALARLLEMGIEPYQVTSAVYGVVSQRLLRRRAGDDYRGRVPDALLDRSDAAALSRAIRSDPHHTDLATAAAGLVRSGITDELEARRVLGIGPGGLVSRATGHPAAPTR